MKIDQSLIETQSTFALMNTYNFDTLSQAMNVLSSEGYTEDFKAEENFIKALYSKKEYLPENLKIDNFFRFEGMTDPSDQSELFAISTNDGKKGTLVMSYSASHNQNTELVKLIPNAN